jgi:hypothetical protein
MATKERASIITDIITTNTAPNAKETLVFTKIGEVGVAIADYFSDFSKTTDGQKSVGDDTDATLAFVADAYKGMLAYPEILSARFDKEDFTLKVMGLMHFFLYRSKVQEALNNQWDTSVMICKTDAFFYANKFYNIIILEKDPKYKPLADSMRAYYKKKKQDDGKKQPAAAVTATDSVATAATAA